MNGYLSIWGKRRIGRDNWKLLLACLDLALESPASVYSLGDHHASTSNEDSVSHNALGGSKDIINSQQVPGDPKLQSCFYV